MLNLQQDLEAITVTKEAEAINKSLLIKHKKWRVVEEGDDAEPRFMDLNPSNWKKMKLGEKYTQ